MGSNNFTMTSDPKRISSQIEFVELMMEKDSQRLEKLSDENDIEVINYVLRITEEIKKSLEELQNMKAKSQVV